MWAERRHVVIALVLALPIASGLACGAFSADDPAVEAPDAAPADAPRAEVAPPAPPPPPKDGAPPCEPEPAWVTPEAVDAGVSKLATCAKKNGVDLLSDPDHCGRCDHPCRGHTCLDGLCRPTALEPAGGLDGIYDDGVLYWSGTTLKRIGSDGGRVSVATLPEGGVQTVGTDSTHVYVRQYLATVRFPRDGGAVETLSTTTDGNAKLLIGPSKIFYGNIGSFASKPKEPAGSGTTELFSGIFGGVALGPQGGVVALVSPWQGTDVTSELRFADANGGNKLVLATEKNLIGLAVDSDYVYSLRVDPTVGGVYRARLPPNNDGKLELVAPDNTLGEPSGPYYDHVWVDATHVYWSQGRGLQSPDIMKRAKCGGAQVRIARDIYSPHGFTILGGMIYWVDSTLVELPK